MSTTILSAPPTDPSTPAARCVTRPSRRARPLRVAHRDVTERPLGGRPPRRERLSQRAELNDAINAQAGRITSETGVHHRQQLNGAFGVVGG